MIMNSVSTQIVPEKIIDRLIDRAFEEDIDSGDVTTNAIIDPVARGEAVWKAKDTGIVAGLDIAAKVFGRLDADLQWMPEVQDGEEVAAGRTILVMRGKTRAILTAERIALNIAQRMSGIATKTRRFVEAVQESNTQILDTRKTVPGLRLLDKYAVRAGGGQNHRMGLYDLALIKDNHIAAAGNIARAVQKVRDHDRALKVEVETTTLGQSKEARKAGTDIISIDNMSIEQMREAVERIGNSAKTEASGNITLQNVREVAETGVDYISVGALTHSVNAFDISQTWIIHE